MKSKNKSTSLLSNRNVTAIVAFVAVFTFVTVLFLPKTPANSASPPAISVSNEKMIEGDSGSRTMNFTVSLSEPAATLVTVYYGTGNLGASNNATGVASATTAGGDYITKKLTKLSFSAGQVQKTISVPILGDTSNESDEIFTVNLSSPVGSTLRDTYGTGTILNDDASTGVKLGIGDASIRASQVNTRTVNVPITLSTPQAANITVTVQSIAGSAVGVKSATSTGGDYVNVSKTIRFTAGNTFKQVPITIFANASTEGTRSFTLKLTSSVGTVIRDTATVTIRDPYATYNRAGRQPGPPRVAIVGDSVTGNYEYFTKDVLENKGASILLHGEPATGILDANKCNGQWANSILAEDPDIVIFENIGNYNYFPTCSPTVTQGSPAYYTQWQSNAQQNTTILTSRGAQFFWILNPSVSQYYDPSWWSEIPTLNNIYTSIANSTPNTHTIDAWGPFGGDPPNCSLRETDSAMCLHLNPSGQLLMTSLVNNALASYLPQQ